MKTKMKKNKQKSIIKNNILYLVLNHNPPKIKFLKISNKKSKTFIIPKKLIINYNIIKT